MTNAMPPLQMMIKLSYGWRPLPLPLFVPGEDFVTSLQTGLFRAEKILVKAPQKSEKKFSE